MEHIASCPEAAQSPTRNIHLPRNGYLYRSRRHPGYGPGRTVLSKWRTQRSRRDKRDGCYSRADNNTFNLSKAQLRVFGPYIDVSPQGWTSLLTKTGGPQPPYTVSDIGDIHVQSGQFDIYRFPTNADALNFRRRTAPTTIVVPAVTGAQCPAGFTRVP